MTRLHRQGWIIVGSCLLMALTMFPVPAHADTPQRLIVAPDGPFVTIEAALKVAATGDVIEVHGGMYAAPLVIEKSVTLTGIGQAIIDGQGEGSLVYILAPDVTLQGFEIRNSGNVQHHQDAGVVVEAQRATLRDNRIHNVLYGVLFNNAAGSVAQRNIIRGMGEDIGLRGDGFYIWYSNDISLLENTIVHTRDTLISYSNGLTISGNHFEDNRYGLHFMYNNGALVEGNTFVHNSVGSFLMSSHDATVQNNIFAYNRGSSGYGLALKDMDNVTATDNFFVGNIAGVYLDNSPSLVDVYNTFRGNTFVYNDEGVTSLPSVARNIFTENSFLENTEQVSMRGREILSRNQWSWEGRGNYWSDYTGYDRNGDGVGETTYQSDQVFENLVDDYPVIQLFAYGPVVQAIEFSGSAFPVLRPQPRLVDDAPLMNYRFPPYLEKQSDSMAWSILGVSLGFLSLAILPLLMFVKRPIAKKSSPPERASPISASPIALDRQETVPMITATHLTKCYGKHRILNDVSFSIQPGEAVALWGTNGAGKTTTLRCLLGTVKFMGQLTVNSLDVKREGKRVRASIGYVPQETAFYDMTIGQTMQFYAKLKRVATTDIAPILERVDLAVQTQKPVKNLSGGMKQRLALAVSLLGDPPVLLFDEPTANLDTQSRQEFLHLVHTFNQDGKTILFSTHRPDEVLSLASRVLGLRDGQVILDGPPDILFKEFGLSQWLRMWIPAHHWQAAIALLSTSGFRTTPNGHSLFVQVGSQPKISALRLLETAQIPVEDFDVVDSHFVPEAHS